MVTPEDHIAYRKGIYVFVASSAIVTCRPVVQQMTTSSWFCHKQLYSGQISQNVACCDTKIFPTNLRNIVDSFWPLAGVAVCLNSGEWLKNSRAVRSSDHWRLMTLRDCFVSHNVQPAAPLIYVLILYSSLFMQWQISITFATARYEIATTVHAPTVLLGGVTD